MIDFDHALIGLVPPQLMRRLQILPVSRIGRRLTAAIADPEDQQALDRVGEITGLQVRAKQAPAGEIARALAALVQAADATRPRAPPGRPGRR